MKLEYTPTAIDHVKSVTTKDRCYAVSWTEDNQVLTVTRKKGIDLRDADLEVTRNIMKGDNVIFWSARLFGSKLVSIVSSDVEESYTTYFGSLGNPTQTVLHTEGNDDELAYIRHPSINKHYIVHIEMISNTLKVFSSANGRHLFDIKLRRSREPFCTLITDDAVLVTDVDKGKTWKYELTPSQDPVWTYKGLCGPSGIAVDESGLIYLASSLMPTVHILCPDTGELTNYSYGSAHG